MFFLLHLIFRFVLCFAHCINFVVSVPGKRVECTEFGFHHPKNYGSRKSFSQSFEYLFVWRWPKRNKNKIYQNQSDAKNSYQQLQGQIFTRYLVRKICVPFETLSSCKWPTFRASWATNMVFFFRIWWHSPFLSFKLWILGAGRYMGEKNTKFFKMKPKWF